MSSEPTPEKPVQHAFQAEVSRILDLMVHSVYTEKEIFLRELISNASDALDKLRYLSLTSSELMAGDEAPLAIRIEPRMTERAIVIRDNGIGMSAEELSENLGTIARSGTRSFLEQVAADKAGGDLIGQFGVGFYSAFMVADRVEVVSRRAGSTSANRWVSEGPGGFTVEALEAEEAAATPRGTSVLLHLKDDALEFMEEQRIEDIVRSYSDHVLFPIELAAVGEKPRQINSASALWTRSKADVTAQQYAELYRGMTFQFDEPALTIHYKAEGRHEYTVLLFVPGSRPYDLFDVSRKGRVRLYVRRVFITDAADLLPPYLRFVRGVVDSQDMPLNISREMLQNNPLVASIRKAVTNRVLSELKSLAEKEPEAYAKVWAAFGAVLKEGLYEDSERRDALYELLRFRSTASGESLRSLKEYMAGLRPNQTAIHYLVGDQEERLKASPLLEGYRARGVEVLLLSDPVDNFWVTAALGYEGKPFRSLTQGEADLDNIPLLEGKEAPKSVSATSAALTEALRKIYGDAVSEVRVSGRLTDSPACLVAPTSGPDRGLERIMARQQGERAASKPVLEINLGHPLVARLDAVRTTESARFRDLAWLLLDQARILEGGTPEDPAAFTERLNRLLLAEAGTKA